MYQVYDTRKWVDTPLRFESESLDEIKNVVANWIQVESISPKYIEIYQQLTPTSWLKQKFDVTVTVK